MDLHILGIPVSENEVFRFCVVCMHMSVNKNDSKQIIVETPILAYTFLSYGARIFYENLKACV